MADVGVRGIGETIEEGVMRGVGAKTARGLVGVGVKTARVWGGRGQGGTKHGRVPR